VSARSGESATNASASRRGLPIVWPEAGDDLVRATQQAWSGDHGALVEAARRYGADGVLITGCHPGECHYIEQNYKTIRRHAMLKYFLEQMGIEPDRLRLVWASAAEGQYLAESIDRFVGDVRKLGPLNWSANWQEDGQRMEALEAIVGEHAEAMEVRA